MTASNSKTSPTHMGDYAGNLLLFHVNDFCRIKRPRIIHVQAMKELFYSLIANTAPDIRKKISIALSSNPYTPRPIIFFLAMEPIGIAAPVLLNSPVLEGEDFFIIAEQAGLEHASVLARRSDLPATIKAGIVQKIRHDHVAKDAPNQKQAQTNTQTATDKLLAMAAKGGKLGSSQKPASHVTAATHMGPKHNTEALEQLLLMAARNRDYQQFGKLVQSACNLRTSITAGLIEDKNAGILACLFHVLGISDQVIGRLILLLAPLTGRDFRIFQKVMHELANLNKAAALNYFKELEPNFQLPSASRPLHVPAVRPQTASMLVRGQSEHASEPLATRSHKDQLHHTARRAG